MSFRSWLESVAKTNLTLIRKKKRRWTKDTFLKSYDVLENRQMLAYMFVDFGDMFPGGTLETTQGGLRDIADDPVPGERILGTQLRDAAGAFNAATPLNIVAKSFTDTDRSRMMSVVRRAFLPLDITVVELTDEFQATDDGRNVRGAEDIGDVIDILRSGDSTSKDAYIFVGQFDVLGANPISYGPNGGGNSPVSSLDTSDLSSATNAHDDVALVFARGGFNFNTMNNISHEAGHNFGHRHAITNSTNDDAVNLFHQAEIMSYRNTNNTTSSTFTRFPMIRGDGNSPSSGNLGSYNSLAARTGDLTPYDQLSSDANIGANPDFNFVSGTGAHDIITITKNGTEANVSVEAFGESDYTSPIIVPSVGGTVYSYTIPLDKPILIFGGGSDDQFVIDGDLGVDILIDGMRGTDSLRIEGKSAASATYTPNTTAPLGADLRDDFGGQIEIGGAIITFENFDVGGRIEIDNVDKAIIAGSAGDDQFLIDNLDVAGSVSGLFFVPMLNSNVGELNINAFGGDDLFSVGNGNIDADAPITVDGGGNATLQLDDLGRTLPGAYTISSSNVSRGGASVTYNNLGTGNLSLSTGTGDDTFDVVSLANHDYSLVTGMGSDTLILQTIENMTVTSDGDLLTVRADTFEIDSSSTINADSVVLTSISAGRPIDLGSTTDLATDKLEISTDELDRIVSGFVQIGDDNSGDIVISSAISPFNISNMRLASGGAIVPMASGTDLNVGGTIDFSSGTELNIGIDGIALDTQYQQLNIEGQTDLTGLDLVLTGTHSPAIGEQFIIVANDGLEEIAGTFNGLPEGGIITNFLGSGLNASISYKGLDGFSGNDAVLSVFAAAAEVKSQYIYYENSDFDDASDDDAIDMTKQALLPGSIADFSNYTSYSRGINGVVIDVAGLASQPTLATLGDFFQFHVGNDNDPTAWATATAPIDVSVRAGSGDDGSDRITLIWADNVIEKQWLQISMLANANTGLLAPSIHYWGNAIGESGNDPSNALVNLADVGGTRINQTGFGTADIDNSFDFNRDARVNLLDLAIARANQSGFSPLNLIDLTGDSGRSSLPGKGSDGNPGANVQRLVSGNDTKGLTNRGMASDSVETFTSSNEDQSHFDSSLALAGGNLDFQFEDEKSRFQQIYSTGSKIQQMDRLAESMSHFELL